MPLGREKARFSDIEKDLEEFVHTDASQLEESDEEIPVKRMIKRTWKAKDVVQQVSKKVKKSSQPEVPVECSLLANSDHEGIFDQHRINLSESEPESPVVPEVQIEPSPPICLIALICLTF